MWGRRTLATGVIASVLSVLATGMASAADGRLHVRPAHGPVGSQIDITGHVRSSQRAAYAHPAYLGLLRDSANCELLVAATKQRVSVTKAGAVHVRFTVSGHGTCFQGSPSPQPVSPGEYRVIYPCHACTVGRFRVTTAGPLPFTGLPVGTVLALGASLVVAGVVLVAAYRIRPRRRLPTSPVGSPSRLARE
jgi:hypothetical protein